MDGTTIVLRVMRVMRLYNIRDKGFNRPKMTYYRLKKKIKKIVTSTSKLKVKVFKNNYFWSVKTLHPKYYITGGYFLIYLSFFVLRFYLCSIFFLFRLVMRCTLSERE